MISRLFLQGVKPEQNLSEKGLETKKLENFSLETGFMELSKLLQMQALFAFMKDLNALSLNKWTKAYEGVNDTAILFCCKEKKYPEDLATSEEFKEFEKNFTARQRVQQSETLLREMLEDTMNNSGIIR